VHEPRCLADLDGQLCGWFCISARLAQTMRAAAAEPGPRTDAAIITRSRLVADELSAWIHHPEMTSRRKVASWHSYFDQLQPLVAVGAVTTAAGGLDSPPLRLARPTHPERHDRMVSSDC
jgi:hypothetical protein